MRGCQPVNQRWVFGLAMSKFDDTLDVARESVTVESIELPNFPVSRHLCRIISFERGDGWVFDGCARIQERQGMVPQDGEWMVFGQQDGCFDARVDLLATGYSSQHVDASRLRVHVEGYLVTVVKMTTMTIKFVCG